MVMGRSIFRSESGQRPQQAGLLSFFTLNLGSRWGKACWEDAGTHWFSLKMRKG